MIIIIGFLLLIISIQILLLSIDCKLDKIIKYCGLDKKNIKKKKYLIKDKII